MLSPGTECGESAAALCIEQSLGREIVRFCKSPIRVVKDFLVDLQGV